MPRFGRREFLARGGVAVAAVGVPFAFLYNRRASAAFGPLVDDPNGILDLPAGFSYQILQTEGDDMDDGYVVPAAPDGMAAFAGPAGTLILMRNHENSGSGGPYSGGQQPPPEAYDENAEGGVTRVVVDATTFELISSNLVLVGTIRNCAGGPSPWGWISCEETFSGSHGYCFVTDIAAESVQAPNRVVAWGHFNHEAAAVDPATNICYLTEDQGDSSFYRFVPDDMGQPFAAGVFQALKVVGIDEFDTDGMSVGDVVDVEWVDVANPDPAVDDVRTQAQNAGAAVFVRGEGLWFFDGAVYICSTSGGVAGAGQIFRLIDGANPTLELIAMSTDPNVLDAPDNICVAPWGEVFMAEDGGGTQYIRGLDAMGTVYDFARNAVSDSEFAGVCFSPDGKAMFVNIQSDGLTLVITGPFPDMGVGESGSDSGDAGSSDEAGASTSDDGPVDDSGEAGDTSNGSSGGDGGTGSASGDGTTSGGSASASGTGGSASASASATAGTSDGSEGGSESDSAGTNDDGGGCGCTSGGGASGLATALFSAALLGIDRRVLPRRSARIDEREPTDES